MRERKRELRKNDQTWICAEREIYIYICKAVSKRVKKWMSEYRIISWRWERERMKGDHLRDTVKARSLRTRWKRIHGKTHWMTNRNNYANWRDDGRRLREWRPDEEKILTRMEKGWGSRKHVIKWNVISRNSANKLWTTAKHRNVKLAKLAK